MAEVGLIYKLVSPNGKIYIGQTTDFKGRIKKYRTTVNCKGRRQPKLYRSILKYGFDNFKIEILEENIAIHLLDEKEIQYIKEFNSFKNGLNCNVGGKVLRGKNHPMFGRHHSQETKNKISTSKRGKTLGVKRPDLSRIQLGKKRKPFTAEHIKNMSISQRKRRELKRIENVGGLI